MTSIAKVLLGVQFGLNLALAMAAFRLYTNRLDWTPTAAKADQSNEVTSHDEPPD